MKERSYKHCCLVAHLCPILQPHGLQQARLPCPSPSPRDCSNSCPLSQWCHLAILSPAAPFSSYLKSFPASGSFRMRQFFASGSPSIGISAQHQSFQWIFRTDFLSDGLLGSPFSPRNSPESFPAPQFKGISSYWGMVRINSLIG